MVNQCVNPACGKPLHYLREGKIFLFSHKQQPGDTKNLHRLEHYWLCGSCTKDWTLTSDEKNGVQLVATRRKRARQGYATAVAPAS